MLSRRFSQEPSDKAQFTGRLDRVYTTYAAPYSFAVKHLPVWKTWLNRALPFIEGPRVLEISFGTGYLLSRYGERFECVGLDYNWKMVKTAGENLARAETRVPLLQGNVEALPFADETFDCIVNTMAFSGYPDGEKALGEIRRVLKRDGRLVLIDIGYPEKAGLPGTVLANLWKLSGDLIRNMPELLKQCGFETSYEEIGGFGSVHLFVGRKCP